MFDIFETINEIFGTGFSKNEPIKKKRKYTKRTYKEKDCIVTYDPSFLFKPNMPGEYVNFIEL